MVYRISASSLADTRKNVTALLKEQLPHDFSEASRTQLIKWTVDAVFDQGQSLDTASEIALRYAKLGLVPTHFNFPEFYS